MRSRLLIHWLLLLTAWGLFFRHLPHFAMILWGVAIAFHPCIGQPQRQGVSEWLPAVGFLAAWYGSLLLPPTFHADMQQGWVGGSLMGLFLLWRAFCDVRWLRERPVGSL